MTAPRPRLLVIAPRTRYINPSEEALLAALAGAAEVVFHGPGFTDPEALEPDARRLWERAGPFDAALLHQYFHLDSLAAAGRDCWPAFDLPAFLRRFPRFGLGFGELPCPRLVMLTRMDYYAVDATMRARLEAHPGQFLTWPAELVPPLAALPDLGREAFAPVATDEYHRFAAAGRRRIVPFVHAIDPAELVPPGDWSGRAARVLVPGQGYAARREAVVVLARAGLARRPGPDLAALAGRGLRLLTGRGLHARRAGIDILQRRFRRAIASVRACYTEGSRLRWPVRKYFEIPALGTLLIAEPFAAAEALGFVAGETYLAATPDTVADVAAAALREPEAALALARRGHAMVRACHTSTARAAEVLAAIAALAAGRYAGAHWEAGRLVVEQAAPAAAAAGGA